LARNLSYIVVMQNHYIQLKSDTLKTIVYNEEKVLVMFGSKFCSWCKKIVETELNDLANENKECILVYVESETSTGGWNFPRSMRLLSKEPDQWPWWAYFENGELIDTTATSSVMEVKKWLLMN